MRAVIEKLCALLRKEMGETAEQALSALRFCGIPPPRTTEVPVEFEALIQQLVEFIQVFKQHWTDVREDFSSYEQLFGSAGAGAASNVSPTQNPGSTGRPSEK